MIETMDQRDEKPPEEAVSPKNPDAGSTATLPTAYIPACGTLCDAFWWARRSIDRDKPSD